MTYHQEKNQSRGVEPDLMGLADNGLKTAIVNLRIEMENKIFFK